MNSYYSDIGKKVIQEYIKKNRFWADDPKWNPISINFNFDCYDNDAKFFELFSKVEGWNHSKVINFKKKRIGAGKGFRSSVWKLNLEWESPNETLSSVVLKLSLPIKFYDTTSNYTLQEIKFYHEIGYRVKSLYIPKTYAFGYEESGKDGWILMEDLSSHTFYEFEEEIPFKETALAVKCLAIFHSEWWEHPNLASKNWIQRLDDPSLIREFINHFDTFANLVKQDPNKYPKS